MGVVLFPAPYFGGGYFGGSYWGAGGGATVHPGLVEALAAALSADPALSAAYPGGWSNGGASRDDTLPYGVLLKTSSRPLYQVIGRRSSVHRVAFHLVTVAASAEAAEALSRLLASRVAPAAGPGPPPLLFAGGVETGRYLPGPDAAGESTTALDAESRGPTGSDVWQSAVPLTFTVTYNL